MRSHAIAVINTAVQDAVMELLVPLVLLATLGVLAQIVGYDSRNADTRSCEPSW
jgi:hypothetical protein